MRKFIYLLFIIIFPCLIFGQEVYYSQNSNNKTIAKDQYGNIIATGQKDYSGAIVWKDQYGNIISKQTIDYLGRYVIKDNLGNTTSVIKDNYLGEYEETDQYGNIIGKYKRNYLGEVVKTDEVGNIIGKYKYDYNGNLIYQTQELPGYKAPNSNGAYSNPKIIQTETTDPYSLSPESYDAIGRGIAIALTGFGIYGGYNSGFNLGADIWLGKILGVGIHFGTKNIPDSDGYGDNIRTELALNLGVYLTKRKNLILKTSFGYTDLELDYEAYPDYSPELTFEQWEAGYNIWANKGYTDLFYKVGLELALSKKNKGSGFSPGVYYSNNGIGFSLGYIFNRKNNLYNN